MNNFNIKKFIQILVIVTIISVGLSLIAAKIQGQNILKPNKETTVIKGKGNIDEVKEFDVKAINKVFIDTVSSDVNIILSKDNNIKVHFYGTTSDMGRAPKLEASLSGDNLDISVKYPKQIIIFGSFSLNTKLDVYVPESYKKSMDIETVSGEIDIDKLESDDFKCHTTSGDMKINLIVASTIDFSSVSGSINIEELSSKSSDFETTSGDVKIEAISGDLKVESVSGSITALYKEFNNEVEAETVSGDVNLSLPQESEFKVDFSTTSGELENDFPLVITGKVDKRDVKGTVGNGQKTIRIETTSGDAAINKR